MGPRLRDALALLFLAALNVAFCEGWVRGTAGMGPEAAIDADALFGEAKTELRHYDDMTPIVVETPRDQQLVQRWRAGHFDLWNPLQGTGVPFAPDQGGIFSPLRLIYFLFPSRSGYALFHAVRLFVAASGAYFLARARRTSRLGSLVAGVVFGFGGGMVAQLPFVSCGPICFFPWVLAAETSLVSRPSAWRRVFLGLAVACALTGGHPTLAATVLIGGVVYGLAHVFGATRSHRERAKLLFDLSTGWVLGVAFAAPFVFSFVEYLRYGYSYKDLEQWRGQSALVNLTRMTLGPAISAPGSIDAVRDHRSRRLYPYMLQFVAGTAGWVLAFVGFVRRRAGGDLLVVFAVGLALSLGVVDTKAIPLIGAILARYYWPLMMLPIACAAAQGMEELADLAQLRRSAWARAILPALAIWIVAMIAACAQSGFASQNAFKPGLDATLHAIATIPVTYHLVVLGALGLVFVVARFFPKKAPLLGVAVVTGELLLLMRPHLREKPAEALRRDTPSEVKRLATMVREQHVRMMGSTTQIAMPALPSLAGIADIRVTAALVPARYNAFVRAAGFPESFTFFSLPSWRTPWSEIAAARYFVTDDPGAAGVGTDPSVRHVATLPLSTILETPTSGRARLFFDSVVAANQGEATADVHALADSGTLLRKVVLEPSSRGPEGVPKALEGDTSREARWVVDEPDEVVLQTDASAPGYLVLADTYYPGWRATVDGVSTPIFPADIAFRAVKVSPGKHTVRFVYQPTSVRLGIAALVSALVLSIVMVWRSARRKRASADDPSRT